MESVRACVNEKTCAIILETVQGEGGIYPAEEAFLKGLRALCDEKDRFSANKSSTLLTAAQTSGLPP